MPTPTIIQHLTKTVPVKIIETKTEKADDGSPLGIVRAMFSVYGAVDSYGDATQKGCFAPLIEHVKAGGRIPYVFSHNSWELSGYIGVVVDVEDSDEGPICTAELFLDDPEGAKAFRLLQARAVTQHSYQYATLKSHVEDAGAEDVDQVNALDLLDIFEIGPCLRGAVSETDVIDAKGRKAGRVLSAANETKLRAAMDAMTSAAAAIEEVLATSEPKNAGDPPVPAPDDLSNDNGAPAPDDLSDGNGAPPKAHGTTAEDLKTLAGLLRIQPTSEENP